MVLFALFFLVEFRPESVGSVPVQAESICFGGFGRYRLIRHELALVGAESGCIWEMKKKKKKDVAPMRRQWRCPLDPVSGRIEHRYGPHFATSMLHSFTLAM